MKSVIKKNNDREETKEPENIEFFKSKIFEIEKQMQGLLQQV